MQNNPAAAAQLCVLQRYIAEELRYEEEEGDKRCAVVLQLLREAEAAAQAGIVLDPAAAEAFAMQYYEATRGDGMYGDTDMSDALEAELTAALDVVTA